MTINVQRFRYEQVCSWHTQLKNIIDEYTVKVKLYRRRVVLVDAVAYSASVIIAGEGVLLSVVTMTSPVVVTISVSAATAIAGIHNIIAKKISTYTNTKLHEYTIKLHAAMSAYSKLSSLISSYLGDGIIS